MSLDYSSARIFALTLGRRAIDDVRRDGLRQLRNYVDMCAFLAKHPLAKTFFGYAQTVLEDPDTPYYTFTQRLINTVSENTLCTLGVNFGFGSMLYGSEKLAKQARQGTPVAWITFSTSDDPDLSAEVENGEAIGSFLWGVYLKGPVGTALTDLIAQHPKSVFQLVIDPEYLTKSGAEALGELPNIMPAVYLATPKLTQSAKEAFELLASKQLFYAAFLRLGADDIEKTLKPEWLEELAQYAPICVCSRKPGMAQEVSEMMRKQIWGHRLYADGRLFVVDWESDLDVISQHMPMHLPYEVRPTLTQEMPLYL